MVAQETQPDAFAVSLNMAWLTSLAERDADGLAEVRSYAENERMPEAVREAARRVTEIVNRKGVPHAI